MTEAARVLNLTFRRVAATQAALAVATAAGAMALRPGARVAVAALYGGAISMLAAWRLARSLNAATPSPVVVTSAASWRLYVGAAERFMLSGALLALGVAVFRLPPLPLIAGFGLTQLGFLGGLAGGRP